MSAPITRAATASDAGAIARIYNHFVEGTIVTFEEVPVTTSEMADRVAAIAASSLPYLVAEPMLELLALARFYRAVSYVLNGTGVALEPAAPRFPPRALLAPPAVAERPGRHRVLLEVLAPHVARAGGASRGL